MKYFCEKLTSYTAKNKLEEAVYAFLAEFDCLILELNRVEILKSTIDNVITVLNSTHKRCTPIVPKWSVDNNYKVKTQKNHTLFLSNSYSPLIKLRVAREEGDL
jgi:hypothetical protein